MADTLFAASLTLLRPLAWRRCRVYSGESFPCCLGIAPDRRSQLFPVEVLLPPVNCFTPPGPPGGELLNNQEFNNVLKNRPVTTVAAWKMKPLQLVCRRAAVFKLAALAAVFTVVTGLSLRPRREHFRGPIHLK